MSQSLHNLNMLFAILLLACGLVHGLPSVLDSPSSSVHPLVFTKSGMIRGLPYEDGSSQFLGVPYAVVDEKNPFGSSKPHPGWLYGIFEAYKSNECPQINHNVATGTLDCLTMNIYVPRIVDSQKRLPVMVWLHGGGFNRGSADMDGFSPKFLLQKDVIVVAINYRLGAYGFLCLDIPEVPGNQGFKDQVLALRWIKENIESFGGNSGAITVFGQSAGGISANLHIFSPYEKLFDRVIVQSGAASTPMWRKGSDETAPIKIAEALNFNTTNVYEALDYLSTVDAHTIVQVAESIDSSFAFHGNTIVTAPCIEKEFEGVESFLTDNPRNIVSSKAKTTPVMIGYNNNEAAIMFETVPDIFFQFFNFRMLLDLGFDLSNADNEVVDAVRHFYIGDQIISKDLKPDLSNFALDFSYSYPTQRTADLFLANGASTVYRYIFSYSGGRNLMKAQLNLNIEGATHTDELGYLFDYDIFRGKTSPEDQLMIDRMTTIWTNFAKFGNPTPVKTDLLPFKWDPITRTTHPYLDINSELTLGSRRTHARMAFWDLYYKLYGTYEI